MPEEKQKVYVVIRNEARFRSCVGVGRTEDAARRIVREDVNDLSGYYDEKDYEILPVPLED